MATIWESACYRRFDSGKKGNKESYANSPHRFIVAVNVTHAKRHALAFTQVLCEHMCLRAWDHRQERSSNGNQGQIEFLHRRKKDDMLNITSEFKIVSSHHSKRYRCAHSGEQQLGLRSWCRAHSQNQEDLHPVVGRNSFVSWNFYFDKISFSDIQGRHMPYMRKKGFDNLSCTCKYVFIESQIVPTDGS